MASQRYTGLMQSDFDQSHKTLKKEKKVLRKTITRDDIKNRKYKDKKQNIVVQSSR
jgi:hypothetical protein